MSVLLDRLIARIGAEGPMSLADYMAACLGDPEHGYYRRADPFGRAGDFITAPEISQMFGELIGAWAATLWEQMGRPKPVMLVELGPGRGTLMADALRLITRMAADFRDALTLHLVETSPVLKMRQAQTLGEMPTVWHADWESVPATPAIVIANEFFDALPIRQFRHDGKRWQERRVGLGGDGRTLVLVEQAATMESLPAVGEVASGTIFEISPIGRALAQALGRRVVTCGGAALLIDYGARHGHGDSLQAVKHHRRHDPLSDPGEADLTAHVDFGALAFAARAAGATIYGPIDQGLLLGRLGIAGRAAALSRNADDPTRARIGGEMRRLIHPGEMGTLFKAMAITAPALPAPPGFAAPG